MLSGSSIFMATLLHALSGTRGIAVCSGLASVQSAIGTMIVYATQPDNVALDGEGRNERTRRQEAGEVAISVPGILATIDLTVALDRIGLPGRLRGWARVISPTTEPDKSIRAAPLLSAPLCTRRVGRSIRSEDLQADI
jgi:hypothetical protein